MTEWIIECNTDEYDIRNAFKSLKKIDWKQSTNVKADDIVFIYVTDTQSIRYRCKVNTTDLEVPDIDDSDYTLDDTHYGNYGRYMELELLENIPDNLLTFHDMKNHGLKTVRGPIILNNNETLQSYINSAITDILIESEYDKNYFQKFKTDLGISQKQWEEMLQNEKIFHEKDIKLIKRIFLSPHHGNKCKYLSEEEGLEPQAYNKPVVALARRIENYLNLKPIFRDNGEEVFWRVPFWGFKDNDGLFEWKLKPELALAVANVFPELCVISVNDEQDTELIEDLKKSNFSNVPESFEYTGISKQKPHAIIIKGQKTYPRNRNVAINALAHANFTCECNSEHKSFISKTTHRRYMEPHHLIPLCYTDDFDVSLDCEENIVSLCSNCHNEIHYGEDGKELIKKLYKQRKEFLKKIGIEVKLEQLLNYY